MSTRGGALLDRFYRIGVVLKGLDGLAEFVAGLLLWLTPDLLEKVLRPLTGTVDGDHPVRNLIAHWAGKLDHDLSNGPHTFIVLFLLTHGIIKLVLVYCLLREYVRVYPYAISVLVLFAVYQVYVLITGPSVGMALLTLLDIAIIWLVWREWRQLKRRRVSTLSLRA